MALRIHEPTTARVGRAVDAYGPEAQPRLAQHRQSLKVSGNRLASSGAADPGKQEARDIASDESTTEAPLEGLSRLYSLVQDFSLLSVEETVDQAKRVRAGHEAASELGQSSSPRRERLLRHLVAEGERAKGRLLRHNLRLVLSVAQRFRSDLDVEDRFQYGVIGLVRAIEKYDHRLGYRLSTYATWWIRQAISRGIDQEESTIRIPVHVRSDMRRLAKVERRLLIRGEVVGVSSLTEATGWGSQKLAEIEVARSRSRIVLLHPEDLELAVDRVFAEPDVFDSVADSLSADGVADVVNGLRERDARVISLRFGLEDGIEMTLEEIGELFGLTRERIRQIVRESLERIEHQLAPLV